MTASERPKLGAILLAAGGSSRLGRPKQLLKINGETLLRRAARSLADSVYFPVVVVLGAEAGQMSAELADIPVYSVTNGEWAEGMSSSIRKGMGKLLEAEPAVDGLLFALCDQPLITTEILNRFSARFSECPSPIIASAFDGITGVPALFSRELFNSLTSLDGDKGARGIIRTHTGVETIHVPEAGADLDTADDLARFGITNSE